MIEEIIGFVAGILIAISMIPQVIKSYKTNKVDDISFLMLFLIGLGTAFWVVYVMLNCGARQQKQNLLNQRNIFNL